MSWGRRGPVKIPPLAFTYVIWWEDFGVLKVGRCWKMRRIRELTATGGRVLVLKEQSEAGYERYALREIRKEFLPAFS